MKYSVKTDEYIHFPCNSGLRLRGDDQRIVRARHFALPLVVIEAVDSFKVVASGGRLKVSQLAEGVLIQGDALEVMGAFGSLESAITGYLERYPLPETPCRTHGIKRVITLDMWLPDGKVAHDYKDTIRLVDDLSRRELADGTLLYLPGWHAPFDTRYPAYAPSDELGGDDVFRQMLESADQTGVTVMLHLNYWGYDVSSGLLNNYAHFQVRDENDEPQGWPGVLNTGYTNPMAYMRVDDSRWQEIFFRYVEPLLSSYPIKAFFLDQIGGSSGHDKAFDDAAAAILKRLRTIQPDLLLGGEILDDKLITQIDIFQAWGQPWCGLEVDFTDSFSPIVMLMFSRKIKFMSHLGLPCSKPCRYVWTNYPFIAEHGCQEAFDLAQKHNRLMRGIPHVRLAYNRWGIDELSLFVLSKCS